MEAGRQHRLEEEKRVRREKVRAGQGSITQRRMRTKPTCSFTNHNPHTHSTMDRSNTNSGPQLPPTPSLRSHSPFPNLMCDRTIVYVVDELTTQESSLYFFLLSPLRHGNEDLLPPPGRGSNRQRPISLSPSTVAAEAGYVCGFSLFEGQGDKGSVVAPPNDRHQPVGTGGGPPPTLSLSVCLFSCGDRPAPPNLNPRGGQAGFLAQTGAGWPGLKPSVARLFHCYSIVHTIQYW